MVDAWREEWGADLPFGFVELAGFQRQDPPELMSKRIVALERMQQQIASNPQGISQTRMTQEGGGAKDKSCIVEFTENLCTMA